MVKIGCRTNLLTNRFFLLNNQKYMRLPTLQYRFEIEREIIERIWADEKFREELISDPREILRRNFSVIIPHRFKVNIMFEEENEMILVIPNENAFLTEELDDDQLDLISGGWTGMPECGSNLSDQENRES